MSEEAPAPASVNVTRLIHEAASKSGLLWVRLPDGSTHPVWHVWHDDGDERGTGPAAYVVSGPGEQPLPWLPDEVELDPAQQGHRRAADHRARDGPRGHPRGCRVGRRRRGAAARAAQRGGRHRRALAAVVHHPPAHPARPPRRGPGVVHGRLGGGAGAPGRHGDQRLAARGTGAAGPAPAATPGPDRTPRGARPGRLAPDSLCR